MPHWCYSLHRSENSRKRGLWQYEGLLTSVCERWLFPLTQHRTQYNDGSILEVMLWRCTLVPWALERSLAGGITRIHTPEVMCQGWKTWETSWVCSPVSAENTCKAASYSILARFVPAALFLHPLLHKSMINHLEINTDSTRVLAQASHIHKYVYTHERMNRTNRPILLCLVADDIQSSPGDFIWDSGICQKYMLPSVSSP